MVLKLTKYLQIEKIIFNVKFIKKYAKLAKKNQRTKVRKAKTT
jgi:hypothetical protein